MKYKVVSRCKKEAQEIFYFHLASQQCSESLGSGSRWTDLYVPSYFKTFTKFVFFLCF